MRMIAHLNNLAETRPIAVGAFGATGGLGAGTLQFLKLTAEWAGAIGAIFGCIAAILSVALLVKQIRKN